MLDNLYQDSKLQPEEIIFQRYKDETRRLMNENHFCLHR
jgi:hypothetical protein